MTTRGRSVRHGRAPGSGLSCATYTLHQAIPYEQEVDASVEGTRHALLHPAEYRERDAVEAKPDGHRSTGDVPAMGNRAQLLHACLDLPTRSPTSRWQD